MRRMLLSVLREWVPFDGRWYVSQLLEPEIQAFTGESAETTAEQFRDALAATAGIADTFAGAMIDPAHGELSGNVSAQISGRVTWPMCTTGWLRQPGAGASHRPFFAASYGPLAKGHHLAGETCDELRSRDRHQHWARTLVVEVVALAAIVFVIRRASSSHRQDRADRRGVGAWDVYPLRCAQGLGSCRGTGLRGPAANRPTPDG